MGSKTLGGLGIAFGALLLLGVAEGRAQSAAVNAATGFALLVVPVARAVADVTPAARPRGAVGYVGVIRLWKWATPRGRRALFHRRARVRSGR